MLRKTRRFVPFCAVLLITGALLIARERLLTGSPAAQIALWTGASESTDAPRFPGAVANPPEYLTKDVPFDVVELLKPPQPNAEPLYLDALFEFSSDMQVCFPEEERERRLSEIRRREQAYERIRQALENDAASVELSELQIALRLSRDLRPRGPDICQVVSVAIDTIATERVLGRILTADGLNVEQCDRLMTIFSEHQAEGGEMLRIALRMEYVMTRKLLHDLTYRTGAFGPNWREEWEVGENVTLGELLLALEDASEEERPALIRAMNNGIDQLSPESLARSIEHMNEAYRRLSLLPQLGYRDQLKLAQHVEEYIRENDPFLSVFWTAPYPTLVEAFARHQTRLSATKCLIAIRRWQLVEKKPLPRDLGRVLRAAGLVEVPTDAYSGEPMKLAFIDGRPVVYSVGSDGQDNGGRTDWKFGDQPGDFLFPLTPPRP